MPHRRGRPGTAAGSELPGLPGPAVSGKNWDISLRERYTAYAVRAALAVSGVGADTPRDRRSTARPAPLLVWRLS